MNSINIWSVIVAAVVSFGIGALWYSPILFGKEWASLIGLSAKDMEGMKAGVWKAYVAQFIATLVSFAVLGFALAATGTDTASEAAFVGFLAWLGFSVPVGLSSLLWKKASFKLFLIEAVCSLLTLAIGGAIIGAWN